MKVIYQISLIFTPQPTVLSYSSCAQDKMIRKSVRAMHTFLKICVQDLYCALHLQCFKVTYSYFANYLPMGQEIKHILVSICIKIIIRTLWRTI